jgi:hypothetical protein
VVISPPGFPGALRLISTYLQYLQWYWRFSLYISLLRALLNVGMILRQTSYGTGVSRNAPTKFIHPISNALLRRDMQDEPIRVVDIRGIYNYSWSLPRFNPES